MIGEMRKQAGVALIMTLSVILILSVALMKTFESRSIETAHLANSLQRFQAETLSRSIFRAILIAVKTKGLLFVRQNSSMWKSVPVPISGNQYFQINSIKPIDHLFNLNRRFDPDDPWPTVFANMINRLQAEDDEATIPLDIDDTNRVLSAINDWIDMDTEPDDQFFIDSYEEYRDLYPEFVIKNRGLDRLSEVRLIPPFKELGLSHNEIRENFRVFLIDKSSDKQFIDVNLATYDEVKEFLELFEDVEKYQNLFEYADTIAGFLQERDDEMGINEGSPGVLNPEPRFPPPLNKTGSTWLDRIKENITLTSAEIEFFSGRTKHLLISFSVVINEIAVSTEAVVEVAYISETGDNLTIKGFDIISYSMR